MTAQTEVRNLTPRDQPKLWFGFAGPALAWGGLGIADLLLAWKMCEAGPNSWGILSPGSALAIFAIITLILLATVIAAGMVSYRSFRHLSSQNLGEAEATGREEFMALGGLFMSTALGLGVIWLGIPLIIINICVRAR